MKHIHFIYGNQSLEIEEEVEKLISSLLPDCNKEDAVFTFDIEDFFTKDQNQNKNLVGEFKNTCQTVSFFSPVILIHLKNLQNLVARKRPKDPLAKELEKIVLVKKEYHNQLEWFDADTLVDSPQTRFRLTGKQIVKQVNRSTNDSTSLTLDHSWENRQIALQKGTVVQLVSIREFLIQKLNREIVFEEHEPASWSSPEETSEIFSILYQFLENPPAQVEFVLSAQIKNTRELNQDIYTLIKQNANQIKKSILYDDSRPVSWVMERAQKKQLKLNAMLAGLLVEIAGSDFNILNMELEKLSLLVSPGEALTPELLLRSVSQSKSFTVFRITDSLTRKDLKDTLDCLGILLGTHVTDSTAIFALIAAQFRKLLKISWLAQQDLPEKLIIDRLGLNPWIAKQLLKQVQNYTTKELENIVIFLAKSDIQLKYSAKDAKTLLENLCFLICQHAFRNVKTIKSNWLP